MSSRLAKIVASRRRHWVVGSAQPVALGVGPLGVGLVGEEVPAVERECLRQLGLGIRGGAAACCVDPLLRRLLELVGVDLHPPPVDRVPALDGGDERRGRALRPVGLELVAQCVDEVADVVQRGRPRTRPERLCDLLGVDHAVALADEVLEHVSRPLLEPLAAERPLGAVHVHPAEGGDPQPRPADPVRVATPAPVAGVAGAKVEQRAAIAERGSGHPQRAHAAGTARVDPDLGQRGLGLRGALGEATLRTRPARRHAVEELGAPERGLALEVGEIALGARVARADLAPGLDHDDPVRQAREDVAGVRGAGFRPGRHRGRVHPAGPSPIIARNTSLLSPIWVTTNLLDALIAN